MRSIDEFLDACRPVIERESHDGVLWHYTSLDSLVRIAESSCVHMSSFAFMNDPAEGALPPDVLGKCWLDAIDRIEPPYRFDLEYMRAMVEELEGFNKRGPNKADPFVFSLTVLRDSLSQWARYGNDGAGVALGFRVSPPDLTLSGKGWKYGPLLHEILYLGDEPSTPERSTADSAAIVGFRDKLTVLLHGFLTAIQDPTDAENALFILTDTLRPLLKNGAYHEEKEWRLTASTAIESTDLYSLRAGRFGLVPFLKVPLGTGLALTEIMIGPKVPRASLWSLEWLCRKYGIQAAISESKLVYR